MAATSLFVATKVEESTRRIKDFINACAQKAAKNDKLTLEEGSKVKKYKYKHYKNKIVTNKHD